MGNKENEWLEFGIRLPDPGAVFLVSNGKYISIATYCASDNWDVEQGYTKGDWYFGDNREINVTHWRSLPTLPVVGNVEKS